MILAKKLGVRPGDVVGLVGAPKDFAKVLGDLPPGSVLRPGGRGACSLFIWFVRSRRELEKGIGRFATRAHNAHLWIAWKKGKGGSGPAENAVREAGLTAGLVDFKICAINETWSGLLFSRRRPGN